MLNTIKTLGVAAAIASTASAVPQWGNGDNHGWNGGHGGYGQGHGQPQGNDLLTDINVISRSWGQISTYEDNAEDYFGVKNVGLPDGCQIEQAHSLQRRLIETQCFHP